MRDSDRPVLSVVVPLYNEKAGVAAFHASLLEVLKEQALGYEIIYCNDGSTDGTLDVLEGLKPAANIRIISFSRNFGKEIAITAGIHAAGGQAIITIDGDGQHPVECIPQFIERWRAGSQVVIGVRAGHKHTTAFKGLASKIFYRVMNRFVHLKIVPGSTDFRLIDEQVRRDFSQMTERSRITRGLIDWLGYERDYILFTANQRLAGDATYSVPKLIRLFSDGLVSLSIAPLFGVMYVGLIVLPLSMLLAVLMVANAIVGDPFSLDIKGSAYAIVLLLFLVGLLLVSQGIMALYLSHIHTETQNRPLYIIDRKHSRGVQSDDA